MAKKLKSKGNTAVADPVQIMRGQIQAEEQENRDREAEAMEAYLRLIGREKLTPPEAEELAFAARDLGYSPDQISEDQQIIRQAREALSRHDELGELHRKLVDARTAYQSFLERIDLEETVLAERRTHAERQHQLAKAVAGGGGTLSKLANQRPELFNRSVHPPRLIVSTE